MRINEIILNEVTDLEFSIMVQRICLDCKPFLQQNPELLPLWRGLGYNTSFMKEISDGFYYVPTKAIRTPKDIPLEVHKMIDDWFEEQNQPRFRSDSVIFAAGKRGATTHYGDQYLIFPIGRFKFCWSRRYADLADDIVVDSDWSADKQCEVVFRTMNRGEYQFNRNLPGAIESGSEIMIQCSSCYALKIERLDITTDEIRIEIQNNI